jgi:hypothetical protein
VIQNVRDQIRSLEAGALLQGINKCVKERHIAACISEIKLIPGSQNIKLIETVRPYRAG